MGNSGARQAWIAQEVAEFVVKRPQSYLGLPLFTLSGFTQISYQIYKSPFQNKNIYFGIKQISERHPCPRSRACGDLYLPQSPNCLYFDGSAVDEKRMILKETPGPVFDSLIPEGHKTAIDLIQEEFLGAAVSLAVPEDFEKAYLARRERENKKTDPLLPFQEPKKDPSQDLKWVGTLTLEDWVGKMVMEKQTKSPEFLTALSFFGRDKLMTLWLSYKNKQAAQGKNGN